MVLKRGKRPMSTYMKHSDNKIYIGTASLEISFVCSLAAMNVVSKKIEQSTTDVVFSILIVVKNFEPPTFHFQSEYTPILKYQQSQIQFD